MQSCKGLSHGTQGLKLTYDYSKQDIIGQKTTKVLIQLSNSTDI